MCSIKFHNKIISAVFLRLIFAVFHTIKIKYVNSVVNDFRLLCTVSPVAAIMIKAFNTITAYWAYSIPDFRNWPQPGGEDEGDWQCNELTEVLHLQSILEQNCKQNWLTGMQMFSFGEGAKSPSLPSLAPSMGSAPGPRWKLCPEIPVIPIDNFWKFVAFAVPEILRNSRIEE